MKFARPYLLFFIFSLFLSACRDPEAPKPGSSQAPTPDIDITASIVDIPVQVEIEKLTELVLNEVENPLSSGTDEVDANVRLQILQTVEREVEKVERQVRNEVRKVRKKVGETCNKIFGKLFSKIVCQPVFSMVEVTVQIPHEVTRIVTVIEELWVDEVRNTKVRVKHEASLSNFEVTLNGNQLNLVADIDFWLELGVKEEYLNSIRATVDGVASCGIDEELRRVRLEVFGSLDADPAGNLTFKRQGQTISWPRDCGLTAADIKVSDILKLPLIDKAFDSAVEKALDDMPAEYQLRPAIAQAWSQMQAPLQLADNIYIELNPEKIGLSPISGKEGILHTGASILFHPLISYGPEPKATDIPLPASFDPIDNNGEFNLLIAGEIELEEMASELYQRLQDEDIEILGKPVELGEPTLYGGINRELVLGVKVLKPIRATLYMFGTPSLDLEQQTISFPDLDFTLESKNFLLNAADFLLHENFVSLIQEDAVFELGEETQKILERIGEFEETLGPGILTGETTALALQHIGLSRRKLHVYLSAKGTAEYKVTAL